MILVTVTRGCPESGLGRWEPDSSALVAALPHRHSAYPPSLGPEGVACKSQPPGKKSSEVGPGQSRTGPVLHPTQVQQARVTLLPGVVLGSRGGVTGHLCSRALDHALEVSR